MKKLKIIWKHQKKDVPDVTFYLNIKHTNSLKKIYKSVKKNCKPNTKQNAWCICSDIKKKIKIDIFHKKKNL